MSTFKALKGSRCCPLYISFFIFQVFFDVYMVLLIVQLKRWQETCGREGEYHAAKDPRLGLEPGAAAVHGTPALYIFFDRYFLGYTLNQDSTVWPWLIDIIEPVMVGQFRIILHNRYSLVFSSVAQHNIHTSKSLISLHWIVKELSANSNVLIPTCALFKIDWHISLCDVMKITSHFAKSSYANINTVEL